jgi:hypothetical protein
MTETQFQVTSDPSDPFDGLYSSRESETPGIGYPSCSREISLCPPAKRNTNDANGYYSFLHLHPWASIAEIKHALRDNYRRFHTDGTQPNERYFDKTKMIAETLLDPRQKAKYDSTPDDQFFPDKEWFEKLKDDPEFMKRLRARGFTHPSQVFKSQEEELQRERQSELFEGEGLLGGFMAFDYFAINAVEEDVLNDAVASAEWYRHLVGVAPMFSYKGPLKVLLYDGKPDYMSGAKIVMIPRSWPATMANAYALFTVLKIS